MKQNDWTDLRRLISMVEIGPCNEVASVSVQNSYVGPSSLRASAVEKESIDSALRDGGGE